MDSLIEMKSLATQASNETMSYSDRALIGDQIEAIGLDINEQLTKRYIKIKNY